MVAQLTVQETAGTLKTSPAMVLRLIHSGSLRASRVGKRRWVLDPDDIRKYLEGKTNQPSTPDHQTAK